MAHILVVDDDDNARILVAQALARPQRTIHVAAHGLEALEQIAKRLPDLVITDVVMPKMNGWTLVRRLRTTHATAFIPVILMTSLDSEHDRIRGFRLGADDFVSKPISFEELELRVENVLHHAHIGAEAGRNALLSAALAGQLSQFGLATLLTVLELERKTGVLTLERQGELASLLFKDGRLVGAEKKSAADSVFELLSWTSGRFAFSEQVVEAPAEAGTSPGVLLMEAARRMDELIPILEE